MGNTDSNTISKDLKILTNSQTTQDERKGPFLRLRKAFVPHRNEREYAEEVSRVFALRFEKWPAPTVGNLSVKKKSEETETQTPSSLSSSISSSPWSTQISHRLSNAIRGCIYGAALGDAMGLNTEFLSQETIKSHYGTNYNFSPGCDALFADVHRLSFAKGDWTDDTDHLILSLQSLLETNGVVDEVNFAKKLIAWVESGFPELGDEGGTGLGQTTKRVLQSSDYIQDPIKVAKDVWEKGGKKAAPNGAVMRTAVMGIAFFWDLEMVERNAVRLCQSTHADPRCVASCVAISICIAMMLQNICDSECCSEDANMDAEQIVNKSIDQAFSTAECLTEQMEEFRQMISSKDLSELKLDSPQSMGYTFKCAACALLMMKKGQKQKHSLSFESAMNEIVYQGGDADTNATVAGAMIGCLRGYSDLPVRAVSAMPNVAWLEAWTQKLLFMLRLPMNSDCGVTSIQRS